MPNVYFIGLFAVLIVSGLAGSYLKGRSDGTEITRSAYAQRDTEAAAAYAAKEREITEAYRKKETDWAKSFSEASRKYQRELDKNATDYLTILATHPVLRDPGTAGQACAGGPASTPAPSSGRNGSAGAILSGEATTFLLGLATEADSVVLQLTACQTVLETERRATP